MRMVICHCEGFMNSIPLYTAYFTEQGLMAKISTDSLIKELYIWNLVGCFILTNTRPIPIINGTVAEIVEVKFSLS